MLLLGAPVIILIPTSNPADEAFLDQIIEVHKAGDPEVILADEPTGNLDSKTGVQIMNLLNKLHNEKKKTIILVTHDSEMVHYAHRVIYLKDGHVLREEKKRK